MPADVVVMHAIPPRMVTRKNVLQKCTAKRNGIFAAKQVRTHEYACWTIEMGKNPRSVELCRAQAVVNVPLGPGESLGMDWLPSNSRPL